MFKFRNYILIFVLLLICTLCSCKKKYEVIFDYNGLLENEVVETTGNITLKNPIIEGYEFKGWYTANNEKFTTTKVTSSMTLFAKFDKIHTVKLINGNITRTIKTTSEIEITVPTKYGYRFLGWYDEENNLFEDSIITKDTTLTAKWAKEYEVVLDYQDDQNIATYISIGELPDEIPSRKGYVFLGWYTKDGEEFTNKEISEDIKLYAKWFKLYEVMLDYTNGKTEIILSDGKVTLPTLESNIDMEFLGWFYEDGRPYNNEVITSNITFIAKWLELGKTFGIFYSVDDGKFIGDYPTSYITGKGVQLPIPEKKYHEFLGWYLDSKLTDGPYFEVTNKMDGAKTFYAKWLDVAPYQDIIYNLDGGTISSDAITKYIPGEEYQLLNPKKSGYIFKGYYDNKNFEGEKITYIDKNKTGKLELYAKFELLDFTKINISIIGDSISTYEGYVPSGYPSYYPQNFLDVNSVEKTWWHQVLTHFKTNLCVNSSYSGSAVSNTSSPTTISALDDNRIEGLQKDGIIPDIIIIYIGVNDCKVGYSSSSFKKDYELLINKLQNKYSNTQLFVCTFPYSKFSSNTCFDLRIEYCDIVRELAIKYELGLIEIDKTITKDTYIRNMANALHPNADGMKLIADTAIDAITKFYYDNE